MLSTRTTSRFASVCPSASIRVFSRARIRSPRPAWLPSASVISASGRPGRARSAARGPGAASRAAVSFDVAISRASWPSRKPFRHSVDRVIEYPVLRPVVDPAPAGVLGQGGDVALAQLQRGIPLPCVVNRRTSVSR